MSHGPLRAGDPVPVGDDRLLLGEGVRWIDGRPVLVDILAGRLLEVVEARSPRLHELASVEEPLGAVAPARGRPGSFIAAVGYGLARLDPPGNLSWLAQPELGRPGRMRMNDAAADPAGRFWAGSMAQDGLEGAGRLYRLEPTGALTVALEDLTIPNGPAFDAAGRIAYLADSARRVIWRYELDARTGELGERRALVRLSTRAGAPDGMTVDHCGRLWVALWGAGRVACLRADGGLELEMKLPARQPSCVCLAPDAPGCLWVTSATVGLASPGPLDGALFRVPVNATAPPAHAAAVAA